VNTFQQPLSRKYRRYRFVFRLAEHIPPVGRPSPHVEVWKGARKIGNYDIATGEPIIQRKYPRLSEKFKNAINGYIRDDQVKEKLKKAIEISLFDLSKSAGKYGGVPKGVSVVVKVNFPDDW